MDMVLILVREVAVMFLLIGTGMVCRLTGLVNDGHARAMSNVLLLVVVPAMLLRSLWVDKDPQILPAMGAMVVAAALFHVISIFLSQKLIRDPGDGNNNWRVERLAAVLSNAGFMGFPLLRETVGEIGVLYGAVFVGVLNIFSWIWCVPTLGSPRLPVKKLLTNPAILACIAGAVMYLTGWRLPSVPARMVNSLADLNTPLSMLMVGVFLAGVNPRTALRDRRMYPTVLLRNLGIPLVALLLIWVSHVTMWLPGGKVMAISFAIVASCPSAAVAILMPARYGADSSHGAKLVMISTLLSILTLPMLAAVAQAVL